jgi:hypothetical protein
MCIHHIFLGCVANRALLPIKPKTQVVQNCSHRFIHTPCVIFPDKLKLIPLRFKIKISNKYCLIVNHHHLYEKPWRVIHNYLSNLSDYKNCQVLPVFTYKEVALDEGDVLAHIELDSVESILKEVIGRCSHAIPILLPNHSYTNMFFLYRS